MIYIYGLIDPRTDKVRYIGRTNNLERRQREHLYEVKEFPHLHKSKWINQLLELSLRPSIIVLEEVPEDEWEKAEIKWISRYGETLTNLTAGGGHSIVTVKGRRLSEEHKQKVINSLRGRKLSEETKKKISNSHKGKTYKLSAETKRRMSISHKGKNIGESNPMFGKLVSQETRDKISKANTGQKRSEETRNKISVAAKLREERKRNKGLDIL